MGEFWHWAWVIVQIVVVLVALLDLPFAIARVVRFLPTAQNWWSLLSHRRTVKRLAKLETDLKKIDDPFQIQGLQEQFHHGMFVIMYAIGTGLFVDTVYFANVPVHGLTHEKLLVLAFGFFAVAIAVAGWGMFRFGSLLPRARQRRRRQIEQGIKTMRDKLAK
jgi:hypothetical protein